MNVYFIIDLYFGVTGKALLATPTIERSGRLHFTDRCDNPIDRTFGYERELSETFHSRRVMLNGTAMQRADMIFAKRGYLARQTKEAEPSH